MNPLSGYDLLYKGLSERDANRLREDVDKILVASAKRADEVLTEAIQKAVTKMYDERTANPWVSILRDCNADAYGFLDTLASQLWESMLKQEPLSFAKANQWKVKELIEAWQKHNPDQLKEVANAELIEKYNKLEELYQFQVKVAQNRY